MTAGTCNGKSEAEAKAKAIAQADANADADADADADANAGVLRCAQNDSGLDGVDALVEVTTF
jgi:hypothetical protein